MRQIWHSFVRELLHNAHNVVRNIRISLFTSSTSPYFPPVRPAYGGHDAGYHPWCARSLHPKYHPNGCWKSLPLPAWPADSETQMLASAAGGTSAEAGPNRRHGLPGMSLRYHPCPMDPSSHVEDPAVPAFGSCFAASEGRSSETGRRNPWAAPFVAAFVEAWVARFARFAFPWQHP